MRYELLVLRSCGGKCGKPAAAPAQVSKHWLKLRDNTATLLGRLKEVEAEAERAPAKAEAKAEAEPVASTSPSASASKPRFKDRARPPSLTIGWTGGGAS